MRSLGPEDTMPCWYYDKKEIRSNTPSIRDGIDPEVEARYRKEGARFITDTGNKMGLRRYETLATGIVYFHRFYMHHSFRQFPRYVTACCCLFLAGKVEETPKKCKDIIKAARSLLNDHEFAQFGEDPKEEVMTLERILLQTMKFDLQVDHPYKYLLKYAKCLKGNQQSLETMVQMAWTFINDSLYTTLCLQWEPEIIAIALMYLATKLSKFEVSDWNGRLSKHQGWWDMFVEDISIELLEDVCHQVLDLYSSNNASAASPTPATPPQSCRTAQQPSPQSNRTAQQPSLQTVPKKIVKTYPTEMVPVKTPLLDAHKMNPAMDPFQQGQVISASKDPSVPANVMHNYKYAAPMPAAAISENFVPNQYNIPPSNAPYAAPPFNEVGLSAQPVLEGSSYPPAHYEASASFPPPGFINSIPPPRAPAIPSFSSSVPMHYIPEPPAIASAFPRPPPAIPSQFSNPVFPPGVYPPPGFSSSPGLPRAHQGMGRGGVPRLLIRPNTHSNWGV